MVVAGAGLAGCNPAGETSGDDGGDDGGRADRGPPPPPHCLSRRACDGNQVRACDNGVLGQVVENCGAGQTCSEARCTSTACAAVERIESASGCLFYGSLVDNIDHDDVLSSTVILTNQTGDDATANLQVRDGGATWRTVQSLHIPHAGAERVSLLKPLAMELNTGVSRRLGFRISSDRPLTAALIESDDSTEMALSSGGTMLLPHHALGNEYLVMTYPQQTMPTLSGALGSREGASQVMVVATADDTAVTVRLTKGATLNAGMGIPRTEPGDSFTVVLDDGDTLQLFSRDEGTDLSGTIVSSDQPVAVLSGNIFTTYGLSGPGINSPDMALEQMLPVSSWSQSYVAARLGPQANTCDTLFMGGGALWLIGAALDDTRVTFEGPPEMTTSLPAGEMILGKGEVRQIMVGTLDSFLIKGSKPIMAMQGMDCEATLSSGVSTEALWRELRFALPANFDHELMVVRRDDLPVRLDDKLISDGAFKSVGGLFQVARVPLQACVGQPRNCLHKLEGTFGLTLRGMDVLCSYALTVPMWTHCSPFTTPDCIP